MPSGNGLVVLVAQLEQAGTVALLGGGEGGGQRRPQGLAVERLANAVEGDADVDRWTAVGARQRFGVELHHQRVEGTLGIAVVVELASGIGAALLEERRQHQLEASGLTDESFGAIDRRVDGAVEHGGAHGVGEQRRPGGTEIACRS